MPRLTYQAPGVYVEEVPSAQQPIAGVGTNTVGFIGVVPDVIYYPEPNDDYDPVVARSAARLAALRIQASDATDLRRARFEEEIKTESRPIVSDIEKLENEIKDLNDNILPKLAANVSNAPNEDERVAASEELRKKNEELKAKEDEREQLVGIRDAPIPPSGTGPGQPTPPSGTGPGQPTPPSGTGPGQPASPTTEPELPEEAVLLRASVLRPYVLKKFEVKANPGDTKLCTNFTEYTNLFGPFSADFPDFLPTGAQQEKALSPGHRALTHAVNGFFKNGGTRCFVARVDPKNPNIDRTLEAFESIDAVAIVAAPGLSGKDVWDKLVTHCTNSEDRFAILDCPLTVAGTDGQFDIKLFQYETQNNLLPQRSKNAAYYFPPIEVVDPAKQMQDEDPARRVDVKYRGRLYVPPSGHIAGIYARTDEERGVHKAPANTAILGALNVKYYTSKAKQEMLNPQGVNCIREMNGDITVWGARTIGGDRNGEWKYINVRRFFLFLRESIDEGTQWVVFEPNDPALWGKIVRNVSAFLTNVWRSGALFGLTAEEAFYVKCDAELNPPEVRDLGQVITEIGVAIVRPAEFVIFRVTQATGPRSS